MTMPRRAAGLILVGSLFLGFAGCLALVAASSSLGMTSWVGVAATGVVLLVAGTVVLCLAANHPSLRPAPCPIDRELRRIIEEETGQRRH